MKIFSRTWVPAALTALFIVVGLIGGSHNIVDLEAIEDAIAQSCEVEVCVGNADLDVLGQIGALLRY